VAEAPVAERGVTEAPPLAPEPVAPGAAEGDLAVAPDEEPAAPAQPEA
jgi:hypothetical protein